MEHAPHQQLMQLAPQQQLRQQLTCTQRASALRQPSQLAAAATSVFAPSTSNQQFTKLSAPPGQLVQLAKMTEQLVQPIMPAIAIDIPISRGMNHTDYAHYMLTVNPKAAITAASTNIENANPIPAVSHN